MTDAQIDEAIDNLKECCDPRGHDLLEAIRGTWKRYEGVIRLVAPPDGLENESHSRHADSRLRVVR